MKNINKSSMLTNLKDEIRGEIVIQTRQLENKYNKMLKLDIAPPTPSGFETLDDMTFSFNLVNFPFRSKNDTTI